MPKVQGKPVHVGRKLTVDVEVPGTNSYILCSGKNHIISHNSVSLLAGSTPGVNFPISRYYIRRVRLMKDSVLIPPLKAAGFKIEEAYGSEKTTVVVEFPIALNGNVRTQDEVSIWEKVHLAVFIQKYWADNQVSVTIDFDKEKEGDQIEQILNYFQYDLKSISFLPRSNDIYPQMPYEAITKEKYEELAAILKPLIFPDEVTAKDSEKEMDIFCDGDTCTIGVRSNN